MSPFVFTSHPVWHLYSTTRIVPEIVILYTVSREIQTRQNGRQKASQFSFNDFIYLNLNYSKIRSLFRDNFAICEK